MLAAFGIGGFVIFLSRRVVGAFVLYLYAVFSSAGFAHYFYGPPGAFTLKMHLLISGEFATASLLDITVARARHRPLPPR